MSIHTDIALRKTIADYCEVREQAIARYADALRMHKEVDDICKRAGLFGSPGNSEPRLCPDDFRKEIDRSLWHRLFDATGFKRYMDAQAVKEFQDALYGSNPPEFTEETVRSTLISAASQAEEMFARGLYNLFVTRSDAHRTNTRHAFKLPKKVIWGGMLDESWVRSFGVLKLSHWSRGKINDLDRIVSTLAGRPFVEFRLESGISNAFAKHEDYEDDLLRIKGFKSGTIHVYFLDESIVEKANKLIAAYAGAVIPDARQEAA